MTPTERLHDIITNLVLSGRSRQSSVKYEITDGRVTGVDIFVADDDPYKADATARLLVANALEDFPPQIVSTNMPTDIELTRNAKGETQAKVSMKSNGTHAPGLVRDVTGDVFEQIRARFPLLDGTVSHDAPRKP